jgi:hypothetical protein
VRFLLNLFFVILTTASALQACPTCKDSFMKKDGAGGPQMVSQKLNSVGLGFGWSVIFMLAAPASVAGGLVWLVVKNGGETPQGKAS